MFYFDEIKGKTKKKLINLKTHKGDSLLMLAAYNNSYESAKMLLEKGAKVDEKNDSEPIVNEISEKLDEEIIKEIIDDDKKEIAEEKDAAPKKTTKSTKKSTTKTSTKKTATSKTKKEAKK